MRVLVVTAHPDDELLGVGPMLMWDKLDKFILCLTENTRRHGLDASESGDRIQKVGAAVNASVKHLGYEDQRLDVTPFTEIVGKLEQVIKEWEPWVVLTHSQEDLNRDHRVAAEAVLVACRRSRAVIGQFMGAGSYHQDYGASASNWYLTVTEKQVLDAWSLFERVYPDEVQARPQPRSKEGFLLYFAKAGADAGVDYAVPLRQIRRYGL